MNDLAAQLLRFSPDALLVVDEQGVICFANEAVRDLFGYEPDALLGKSMERLVPESLRKAHGGHAAAYFRQPRAREMGAHATDLSARRADGSQFPASIRLAPFHLDGRLYIAAAVRDVTERRRILHELIAAREEAERANKAKSRFLATASHDLRQPLQTIRLLNAALAKAPPGAEAAELLSQQNQAIESATRLLDALLDISRLESGAIQVRSVQASLADMFGELRAEFESVAKAREVALRLDAPPVVLVTDRTLFYQLLQNLLGNALKYTDRGSVSVRGECDASGLQIYIEDTGIGIPADKIERIFDEYYQVDTHGAKRMGVGLGLAIVKEVARLLGYGVNITSSVGAGTRVCVSIPPSFVCTDAPPRREAPRIIQSIAQGAGAVLLLEDHDSVRRATELFLKLEGLRVLSAGNAAEAERLAVQLQPGDVVVADYHLDGQRTGLDVLLEVRRRLGWGIPGVVLTGDLPAVLRSLKETPAGVRFLSKPVDTSALLEAIGASNPEYE